MSSIRGLMALVLWGAATLGAQSRSILDIVVHDRENRPVPGVRLELKRADAPVATAQTDTAGHAAFADLPAGQYAVTAAKEGFESLRHAGIELAAGSTTSLELTLVPALARHESIEVKESAEPVNASVPETAPAPQIAKQLPDRPRTVTDALPMLPGVTRSPSGDLQISGAAEHRSALIVNSADVTDPATGQFGLSVPIDSVESVSLFQTPYLAEYGSFTAGLVSVETRRGGDKWKWELNDPFPDFRIRSWHMNGIRDATPRVNTEGPLIHGKLYFSEGLEFEIRKIEAYTLPYPQNQQKIEGVNSFAQLDWVPTESQLVTATIHAAPQKLQYVGINYFNPEPTSPDATTSNYTVTLGHRLTLGGGLLDNTLSATRFSAEVWPQGPEEFVITPQGNAGNYFAQQVRRAWRAGWAPGYSFAPSKHAGVHNFKLGFYIAESKDNGSVTNHPVDVLNAAFQMTERISFTGGRPFQLTDRAYAIFGEDHWNIGPRLAVDLGIRTESQAVSGSFRVAPRAGIAWQPFSHTGTVLRAGAGFFYDRVPLNVYSFNHYPRQTITYFDPSGNISAGPYFFGNALDQVNVRTPFVFRSQKPGNFSPRSAISSVQIEQPVTRALTLRLGYLHNESDGLVILNRVAPDPETGVGAFALSGAGVSRYQQIEFTGRVRMQHDRELFLSYIRASARGDLNDFNGYLGTFARPIIRPNTFADLPADLPNRFLAWGSVPLTRGLAIYPVVEYRNGLPYLTLDAAQNYVGIPNQTRYPNFLSVDARVSKDVKVSPKYTLRFSVALYNLTNHFNPEAVHANVADPAHGLFFGYRSRWATADFDVIY